MSPKLPIEFPVDVFGQYGLTMLNVQVFERMLALAVLTGSAGSQSQIADAARLDRALERMSRKITHAFQRATAKELRGLLPADFDPALVAEIEALIPVRDRLAHRYLVERLGNDSSPRRQGEARAELDAMGNRFHAVSQTMASRPRARVPPEFTSLLLQRLPSLVFGEIPPA
jgi:hypothetical protein